jgi:hypothetical protein
MVRYLVEVFVPNRGDALARARADAERLSRSRGIRYVRTILVAEDEVCFHVLDATSADLVGAAAKAGAVPVERIAAAVEISHGRHEEEP